MNTLDGPSRLIDRVALLRGGLKIPVGNKDHLSHVVTEWGPGVRLSGVRCTSDARVCVRVYVRAYKVKLW